MEIKLPTAIDDEKRILGAALTMDDVMHEMRPLLDEDDFALEAHRRVWGCMCAAYDAGRPVDVATTYGELVDRKYPHEGWLSFLVGLEDGIPQNPHIEAYVHRVKEKATLRRIILAADGIMKRAALSEPSQDLIGALSAVGSVIAPKSKGRGLQSTGELVDECGLASLLAPRKEKGLMFPWSWMNRKTYGMLPAELWVLAGHTSTGKTSAMLQHAVSAARRGVGTAIFSLEVGKEALFLKAVYQLAGVDSERMKSGDPLTQAEHDAIRNASNEIVDLPLYIDTTATTPAAIHAGVRQRSVKNKIGHVIVDYLQLLGNDGRSGTRAEAVGRNAWAMKMLATDFQIPVLLLSQFNRESNKSGKKRAPELGDLKESGDIENHANGVWFIHRASEEDSDMVPVQFMLPKQRDGRRNVYTDLWFMPQYQRFEEKER